MASDAYASVMSSLLKTLLCAAWCSVSEIGVGLKVGGSQCLFKGIKFATVGKSPSPFGTSIRLQ